MSSNDEASSTNNDKCKTGKKSVAASKKIILKNVQEIEEKPIKWLWKGKFAIGKISLIAGHPGIGKSQLLAYVASNISTGRDWPDGTPCPKGKVIIFNAEDDPADTTKPRLIAAGADVSEIEIFESIVERTEDNGYQSEVFDITKDLEILGSKLYELENVVAILIDPITAYLGEINDYNNKQVRAVMTQLSVFAEKYNLAVIMVSHNNKNANQEAINRVIGSVAYVAACRSAFLVVRDKEDPDKALFLPLKNNNGQDRTGYAFQVTNVKLDSGIETSCIEWLDEVIETTADEVLNMSCNPKNQKPMEKAKEFLLNILQDGRKLSNDVYHEAVKEGISKKTLERAKSALKIKSQKDGFSKGQYYWELPV